MSIACSFVRSLACLLSLAAIHIHINRIVHKGQRSGSVSADILQKPLRGRCIERYLEDKMSDWDSR